jgi:hypothetical protein
MRTNKRLGITMLTAAIVLAGGAVATQAPVSNGSIEEIRKELLQLPYCRLS